MQAALCSTGSAHRAQATGQPGATWKNKPMARWSPLWNCLTWNGLPSTAISFGPLVSVIEPEALRQMVYDWANGIVTQHEAEEKETNQ